MEHKVYIPWEDWRCVKTIGQGGFGTVYEIERVRPGILRLAAMKCGQHSRWAMKLP